jgi:hypothetical protein
VSVTRGTANQPDIQELNQQLSGAAAELWGYGAVGLYRTGFGPVVRRFGCQWCSWSRMNHLCGSPFVKV